MTETTDGGVVSLPGQGETTRLFGDTYTIKAIFLFWRQSGRHIV